MLVERIVRQEFSGAFRAEPLAMVDVDDVLDNAPLQLASPEALL
jgi:hypothetical protein